MSNDKQKNPEFTKDEPKQSEDVQQNDTVEQLDAGQELEDRIAPVTFMDV